MVGGDLASAAVVLYSILLVPMRATRDVLRERALTCRSEDARRLRLYGVHLLQVAPLALLGLTARSARPIIAV